jgi:hypothetical protein
LIYNVLDSIAGRKRGKGDAPSKSPDVWDQSFGPGGLGSGVEVPELEEIIQYRQSITFFGFEKPLKPSPTALFRLAWKKAWKKGKRGQPLFLLVSPKVWEILDGVIVY